MAEKLLAAAYQVEVERRGRQFLADPYITKYISEVAGYLSNPSKQGILLSGTPGNGKTTMLLAIQNATNMLIKCNHISGYTGIRFIHALDVVRALMDDYRMFDSIIDEPLLAVDDVGTEPAEIMKYGNISNPIVELIERRYENQLFTIISTNVLSSDIRERYKDRAADRMNEMFFRVSFKNQTYRR